MFVFSGDYQKCKVGMHSGIVDMRGEDLYTGDIVLVFTDDCLPSGLRVVVADQYTTYSNNKVRENSDFGFYIMGIKGVDLSEGKWHVLKVKEYQDVVVGEKWKDFKFNYRLKSLEHMEEVKND